MKRVIGLLVLISMPLMAKSLKQRINALEEKVALLASHEERYWQQLKRLDRNLSDLEEKERKINDTTITVSTNPKNQPSAYPPKNANVHEILIVPSPSQHSQ